jgi:hypothetical protein
MSNYVPEHAAVLEADPKRPYKAYAAAAFAGVSSFVFAWVADEDPFTGKEIATAAVSAAGIALAGFGVTFSVKNPLRRKG